LHKHGYVAGLHLLRFQIGEIVHYSSACASGVNHLKLDLFIAQRNSIVNTSILKAPNLTQYTAWEHESKEMSRPALVRHYLSASSVAAICTGVQAVVTNGAAIGVTRSEAAHSDQAIMIAGRHRAAARLPRPHHHLQVEASHRRGS
jgi:hypothetical protein